MYESFSTIKLRPDEKDKGKNTVEEPDRERITHSDTTKNWEANQEGYKQQKRTRNTRKKLFAADTGL